MPLTAMVAVTRFSSSHGRRERTMSLTVGVAAGVADPGQGQDVLLGLLADDADDVVDGDLAHQPAAGLDHRGADQVVLVEDVGDFLLVHVDGDLGHRLHDLGQGRLALAGQQLADRQGADRREAGVDHIDVEEQLRQVVAGHADVVDGLAHGPELRRGQELALHQAAGRLVLVGQAGLDRRAVALVHGGQHLGALALVQVVDDVGGVVGVQLLQRLGQGGRRRGLQHLLAQVVVQLGDDLAQPFRIQDRDHLFAVGGRQEAHQVGDVGRIQGVDQLAQPRGVAAVGRVDDHLDIVGIERVVVAEREVFQILDGFGFGNEQVVARIVCQVGCFPGHGDLLNSKDVRPARDLKLRRAKPFPGNG
jgi:hypothetical protein